LHEIFLEDCKWISGRIGPPCASIAAVSCDCCVISASIGVSRRDIRATRHGKSPSRLGHDVIRRGTTQCAVALELSRLGSDVSRLGRARRPVASELSRVGHDVSRLGATQFSVAGELPRRGSRPIPRGRAAFQVARMRRRLGRETSRQAVWNFPRGSAPPRHAMRAFRAASMQSRDASMQSRDASPDFPAPMQRFRRSMRCSGVAVQRFRLSMRCPGVAVQRSRGEARNPKSPEVDLPARENKLGADADVLRGRGPDLASMRVDGTKRSLDVLLRGVSFGDRVSDFEPYIYKSPRSAIYYL